MPSIELNDLLIDTKKLKILYVEDNVETRKHTVKMLENFFSDICTAKDGIEGFEAFENEHFDILFTDIDMPNMNGLEMIKSIRSVNKHLPIVIFSAYDEVEYLLESIKHGIDGYILKPFDYIQVEEVLNKIIKKLLADKKGTDIIELINFFVWDSYNEVLSRESESISLTKSELALFRLLSSKSKIFYSAYDIEDAIFDNSIFDIRRVRNLLSRLKNKLNCDLVESVYGEGYRFK